MGLDKFVTSISVMKRIVLRSLLAALVLHGVFTIGLPWLLLRASSVFPALFPEIGSARHLGFAAIALGAVLYALSAAELLWVPGVSASPFAQPQFLRTTGCYGRVRNPLLLGVALILLGEALVFESAVLLAYALLYWLWLHLFVVMHEEKELARAFGEAYADYCSRVPRWLLKFGRR